MSLKNPGQRPGLFFSIPLSYIAFINKTPSFIGKPNLLTLSEYGILLGEKV
jgi:hypothetical protein